MTATELCRLIAQHGDEVLTTEALLDLLEKRCEGFMVAMLQMEKPGRFSVTFRTKGPMELQEICHNALSLNWDGLYGAEDDDE